VEQDNVPGILSTGQHIFQLLHIFTRNPHLLLTLNSTPHVSADLSPLQEILIWGYVERTLLSVDLIPNPTAPLWA
jgi:hypothetical protein